MPASQDFRDGAGLGARVLAERLIAVRYMVGTLEDVHIREAAELIRHEYGGEYIEDARAREAARVV